MIPTPTPMPIHTPVYPFEFPTGVPNEVANEAVQYWNLFNSGGAMTLIQIVVLVMIIIGGMTLILRQARSI